MTPIFNNIVAGPVARSKSAFAYLTNHPSLYPVDHHSSPSYVNLRALTEELEDNPTQGGFFRRPSRRRQGKTTHMQNDFRNVVS